MVNGISYPPCSPKLVPLSSANSRQTLGMLLHLQLSLIWEQEALAVQQGDRHRQQNPDQWKSFGQNATPIEQDSTVLTSNQSMPVANESGASTQPWWTPASILNHELLSPTCPNTTNRVVVQHSKESHNLIQDTKPCQSSHNAGQLRESNAARRSTIYAAKVGWPKSCLRCAILHKVTMRSHVERPGMNPLCWGRLCDNSVGLIYARMICANTLPGMESRVIPL